MYPSRHYYEVDPVLWKHIDFEEADARKAAKDARLFAQPCVFMFRTALYHLTTDEQEEFLLNLHQNMKPGSVLILGGEHLERAAKQFILDNDLFTPVRPGELASDQDLDSVQVFEKN